ncbi:uncharacterized protein LOC127283242 [Leptopilina boulardi]|uniref:uncharacterized protein LOC127283242 n=1 Tax=Leptopilina boulardi TaxID=63433 RepID=UPI0021F68684|nr:uncharacterized protein LOC127283242 [Leptopilina boulardi]
MDDSENNKMNSEIQINKPCVEMLQTEALNCLNKFPNKVIELNTIIESYTPSTVKSGTSGGSTTQLSTAGSVSSTFGNYNSTTRPEIDVTSYYSLSTYDQRHTRRGIHKRKIYRLKRFEGSMLRRRPGPLGQLLAFLAAKLSLCTKQLVFAPSYYVIDKIMSTLFQQRELRSVQCGPSANWNSSLTTYITTHKEDNSVIGNLISVMRPAAVQLIADTTVLKRWLQAMSIMSPTPELSRDLIQITRCTETIDCWGYELFFHLKCLQVTRMRNIERIINEDQTTNEEITHINLWHRLIQLRDNYIILYESLHDDKKFPDSKPPVENQENLHT